MFKKNKNGVRIFLQDTVPPPVCERIRAGSVMLITRKLALQRIPIKRRGGSRKLFV
jgi:hypothetical protein